MKIFIAGSFPPPFNGQNIGTFLVKDMLEKNPLFIIKSFSWNITWYPTDNASFVVKLFYYFISFFKYLFTIFSLWFFFIIKFPDVLYIVPSSNNKGFYRDFLFYLPFLIFRKRIVCHIRSGSFSISKFPFKFLYRFSNFHFIFLSELLSKNSFVPKNQSVVIPNFVDEIFNSNDNLNSIASKPYKIVYLSNLFASKGIFSLIDSVKSFSKDEFTLFIYGEGEENVKNKILNEIEGFPNIKFYGKISDRNLIKNIFSSSDLFALPTTYKIEASPRSIIEAISQGCVPLVTNHAGIPDMLNSDFSFMIDKENDIVHQLRSSLNSILLMDPENFQQYKQRSINHFHNNFSYEIIKNKIYNVFIDLKKL